MGFVAPTITPMTRPALAEPFHKQPDGLRDIARLWAARISWRLSLCAAMADVMHTSSVV